MSTIARWRRGQARSLVDLLSEQLSRPDPVRMAEVNVARWMYPLEHRHMN